MSRRELERKIKAHAFSVRQADDILLRRRVQREILPNAKLL